MSMRTEKKTCSSVNDLSDTVAFVSVYMHKGPFQKCM